MGSRIDRPPIHSLALRCCCHSLPWAKNAADMLPLPRAKLTAAVYPAALPCPGQSYRRQGQGTAWFLLGHIKAAWQVGPIIRKSQTKYGYKKTFFCNLLPETAGGRGGGIQLTVHRQGMGKEWARN